ncbi:uncharacterized protein EDB93DRAFT_692916 [Suillus bovinus]|uniref:uncharacterized protein n=1 Tax=Suillus bovinus TaxID=48563 RepID=UPI001B87B7CB|nr:uncharacterized protein EDB93DRAFT_692916 [Suillus bovinus]KAG2139834.1 hypothetical protein EDB93DRAFT_692916 [Suillus bovinus]
MNSPYKLTGTQIASSLSRCCSFYVSFQKFAPSQRKNTDKWLFVATILSSPVFASNLYESSGIRLEESTAQCFGDYRPSHKDLVPCGKVRLWIGEHYQFLPLLRCILGILLWGVPHLFCRCTLRSRIFLLYWSRATTHCLGTTLPLVLRHSHSYLPHFANTLVSSVSYISLHVLSPLTYRLQPLKFSSSFRLSKYYSSPYIFNFCLNHATSVFNPEVLCSHPCCGGSRGSGVRLQVDLRKVLWQADLRKMRSFVAHAAPNHPRKTERAGTRRTRGLSDRSNPRVSPESQAGLYDQAYRSS